MPTDKTKLDYYIDQARQTGKNLSRTIREMNQVKINPTSGEELELMPVYESENGQVSLLSYTQEIVDTEIVVVAKQPEYVDAYWKKYGDKNIVVLTEQNYCWTRFYACKELMQHYLYDTGEKVEIELSSLNRLILEIASGASVTPNRSEHYILDVYAYFAAVEFLLPDDVMPLIKATVNKLETTEGKDKAIEQMAIWMRVPQIVLEFKLEA